MSRAVIAAMLLAGGFAVVAVAQPPAVLDRLDPALHETGLGTRFGGGRVIRGESSQRLVLFTFDDGPYAPYTARLLDHLDAASVKAVFFINGHRMLGRGQAIVEQARIARDIVRRGHTIGNHTMFHRSFHRTSMEDMERDIELGAQAIEQVVGARPLLFRPPGFVRSRRVLRLVAGRGETVVLGNLGRGDYDLDDPEEIARMVLRTLDYGEESGTYRGGIVILHDTNRASVEAVPLVLAELRRRNCELRADPREELYDIVSSIDVFFEARAGAAYDESARPGGFDPHEHALRQARLRAEADRTCD